MKLNVSYSNENTTISFGSEVVQIKAFQIIVLVSVMSDEIDAWDPRAPRFPAILNVGNNHNFANSVNHLVRWAGIQPASLVELKHMREGGQRVPLRGGSLWLHTNRDPFKLIVEDGIAVYESDGPRLPILGLRALPNSKLQTLIYGNTKQVIMRTPPKWYWPF